MLQTNKPRVLLAVVTFFAFAYALFYLSSATAQEETGLDDSDVHRFQHAYSLWLQPPEPLRAALREEIRSLGLRFDGAIHEPHVTLFGAVYTTNETYVKSVARRLARTIRPFHLVYRSIENKLPNATKRWPAGLTLRYHHTAVVMDATKLACAAFNSHDQQKPHTSLLYDYDGDAWKDAALNDTVARRLTRDKGLNLTWMASEIGVYYTPLRPLWRSAADMRRVVGTWRQIAVYPMKE